MLSGQAEEQLKRLAQEVSEREGCHLYDLEFIGHGGRRVLRVFIDGDQNGVSIDQCANVSRGLSLLLDVEDLIPGEKYELEVSSPGLERPLREVWHFEKAVGQQVVVKTKSPIGGESSRRKQVRGELKMVTAEALELTEDGQDWQIPLADVHKAHLIFEFADKNKEKPSKGNSKRGKNGGR